MASATTNQRVGVLRERHRLEMLAAGGVETARRAVAEAESRRRKRLEGLDHGVAQARDALRVALVVLADLLGRDERAAEIADVDVTEVRVARRSVSDAAVREWRDGLAKAGRRRRGPRARRGAVAEAVAGGSVGERVAGV